MALPGGSSVEGIYKKLHETKIPWLKVQIFITDERNVPTDNPDSNFYKINNELITGLDTVGRNLHYIKTEKPSGEALQEYNNEFNGLGGHIELVVLSSGKDGHIASLFPNHDSIKNDSEGYIEVLESPKPPSERFSLSRKTIEQSNNCIALFFGESKKEAYEKFISADTQVIECPVKVITNIKNTYVFTDVIK
jgi:6-phosphogluconolactonase